MANPFTKGNHTSMRLLLCSFLGGALALSAVTTRAQDQDAEGCKDSAVITRMPGSTIHSCENKEFDQAKMPLGTDKDGNAKEKTVEGEFHSWDYGTREGVSEIQVFRNFETALKKAGFTIDFEESPGTITAHKGPLWYQLDNKGTYYYQTIVTEKAMEQEVTASNLADEINKSGHVAVYGIHFDTGKATIQADSEEILNQIVKLLQDNASLKLRVEGHTDNQGSAAANQVLSDKRAQAVVAWLTGKGINASRLAAKGFGATKPVADNGSEDGRAKNRRVELAKM
jgi:outer membrane protein OmpA-like peptidoglycan-associated protein